MFQVISEILKNEFDLQIRSDEKIKIDIQIIFKTMSTKYFYQHIPPVKIKNFFSLYYIYY